MGGTNSGPKRGQVSNWGTGQLFAKWGTSSPPMKKKKKKNLPHVFASHTVCALIKVILQAKLKAVHQSYQGNCVVLYPHVMITKYLALLY